MVVFLRYLRLLYFPRVRFFSTSDLFRLSRKGDVGRNIKSTRCPDLWAVGQEAAVGLPCLMGDKQRFLKGYLPFII